MNLKLTINTPTFNHRILLWLLAAIAGCFALRVCLDVLDASFRQSDFYFSESFLFSSVWLFFVPFTFLQYTHADRLTTKGVVILFILLSTAIHLLAYPALVWIISMLFFDHTFSFWQNFQYGLTEYALTILAIYSIALLLFQSSIKTNTQQTVNTVDLPPTPLPSTLAQIVVADGHQRLPILTCEVSHIVANSPYVTIHHHTKSYLHSDTLKSMLPKLDQQRFIRIHKSVIVNLSMVQSYRSRMNGDYDVTMMNGTVLRLSRIYASRFKEQFNLIGLQQNNLV